MIRLEQLRLDAGLSRQELAAKADVNYNTVLSLEQGSNTDPQIATRRKLAQALNARPSELLLPATWSDSEPEAVA